jgi:hypothetical protein
MGLGRGVSICRLNSAAYNIDEINIVFCRVRPRYCKDIFRSFKWVISLCLKLFIVDLVE